MAKFSASSKAKLATCHPDLQKLMNEVIKYVDCIVIEGERGEKEQNEAFEKGYSKLKYPKSMHNKKPSLAVDALPYPIDWTDTRRNYYFAGFVAGVAAMLGIKIRQGIDWDSDGNIKEHSFQDVPHLEIVK